MVRRLRTGTLLLLGLLGCVERIPERGSRGIVNPWDLPPSVLEADARNDGGPRDATNLPPSADSGVRVPQPMDLSASDLDGEADLSGPALGTDGGTVADTGADPGRYDIFGIRNLYSSAASGVQWNARHWVGQAYSLGSGRDPNDPLGLSGRRGSGTLSVDGQGELVMDGWQPRLYIYPDARGPWQNVEVTVYYQRVSDGGTPWGGIVVGVRSGSEGHASDPCDAHTYYARLRHDGAADFAKELMHPSSTARDRVQPSVLWPDGRLPFNLWIGWKFVIYNLPGNDAVKLEAYRDLSGGSNGGNWTLVNETVDDGRWIASTDCSEHGAENGQSGMIQLDGGTTFIRNTGVSEARYRWVSVREIAPP